jgi:hypothetical protein
MASYLKVAVEGTFSSTLPELLKAAAKAATLYRILNNGLRHALFEINNLFHL